MSSVFEASPMASPSSATRRLNKKDRLKLITQITILEGTLDGKVLVKLKMDDCAFVDDSSLSLLSLPDGPFMSSEPIKPSFHSFVITLENGQRIYGGSYIYGREQPVHNQETDDHKVVYISRALVALTIRPLVDRLKRLLEWCVHSGGCNPRWLRCLANIRLPQKGRCLRIDLESENCTENAQPSIVSIFRPFSIFPLFDYSLRHLFTKIMAIDDFLLLFASALNEVQILIVSNSYYNLMLISECLTALLNPFKWRHVYVPILPTKLGLNYLDAPTPFIMGINSRNKNFINTSKIACYVDCDNKKIELNVDQSTFVIPTFIEELRNELKQLIDSDPRNESNTPKSEALKRVSELAHKYNVISENFTYLDEIKFNQAVRIVFFKKLKKAILNKYQQFIACVADVKEQVKFDSVSYLSEQPLTMRPFLQNFVVTQMFTTFIDEVGKNLSKRQINMTDSLCFDEEFDDIDFSIYSNEVIEARYNAAQTMKLSDLQEPPPNRVTDSPCRTRLQANLNINRTPIRSMPSSPRHTPTVLTAQTNWKVVETLLKETKIKTKRILLAKMGSDEVGFNSCTGSPSASNVEENSLISALCDLIRRIWSHASSDDQPTKGNSQCPFWAHLVSFHLSQPKDNGFLESNSITPASQPSNHSDSGVTWNALKKRIDSLSQLSLEQNSFKSNSISTKSVPNTLCYDYNSIENMSDITTDVGKGLAFIRLSLERKLLSKHLRSLLSNQELLQSKYKRFAFLRCEEEREQFLTHLLTLNAVDLSCFTNTFTTSNLSYTIVICANSSFNGTISITGSYCNTSQPIHINSNQFNFVHRNFGVIYTLSLAVGLNVKLFVEQCFVRNNITNSLFKFDCNKWLGRKIDDGSIERLLIGEAVSGTINEQIKKSTHLRSSSIGRNWSRNSENNLKDEKCSFEDLQTMLGESANEIIRFYHNKSKSTPSIHSYKSLMNNTAKLSNCSTLGKIRSKSLSNFHNMVSLFFGPKKFLWIMNQIFYYGFKNRRSFRKTFVWDLILQVQCELKNLRSNISANVNEFVEFVEKITNNTANYGKDMKLQVFILASLRDRKLSPSFLILLCKSHLIQAHYENESFFRNPTLSAFLIQTLRVFNEIEIKLDPTLTKEV